MNFRKFISGVSALTIAVSAFAGLAVTASAGAGDTTVLYARGLTTDGDYTAWSDTDVTDWTVEGITAPDFNTTNGLGYDFNKPASATYASKTFDVAGSALVTYEVNWYYGSNCGSNGSYIQFGNELRFRWYNGGYGRSISTNGGETYTSLTSSAGNSTYTSAIKVTVDTATNTIKEISFNGVTSDLSTYVGTPVTGGNTISFGAVTTGGPNWAFPSRITSIKVTQTEQEVKLVDYTVKWVDAANKTTVFKTEGRQGADGDSVSALPADTADFDSEDGNTRYSYNEAASTPTITLDADAENVIELAFDAHTKQAIPITAKAGDVTLATYDPVYAYIGYEYSFGPYAYIEHDGDYYKYNNVQDNGSVPAVKGTAAAETQITLEYTKADNVVWYTELDANNYREDSGHSPFSGPFASDNASGGMNGGACYSTEGSRILMDPLTVDASGTYKISYNAVGAAGSERSCYLAVDTKDTEGLTADACGPNDLKIFEHEVHLDKGEHNIRIFSTGSGVGFYVDYLVVELVEADPTPELEDKGVIFGEVDLGTLLQKTLIVTIDNDGDVQTKSNTIESLKAAGVTIPEATGEAVIGLIIKGVPKNATVTKAVIE